MEILSCQTSFLPLDFHRNYNWRNGVNMTFCLFHTSDDRISCICTDFQMTILLQTNNENNLRRSGNTY